ncbi:hypothetical protein MOSL_2132 [Moraxella osloensis]|nr:hypothetical protein EOL70_24490 [Leucothrix sargassi]BAV12705.1 hypothetical protein MOSL_2132 [Moraxella osloensis]
MKKHINKIYSKLFKTPSHLTCKMFNSSEVEYRFLTEGEVQLAKRVFRNLIDYEKVRIFAIPFFPWQPDDILMAPNGSLYVNKAIFCEDYSKTSLAMQGVFIHEMTHILQYQRGVKVFLNGFILQTAYYLSFKKYNPYKYSFYEDKLFVKYNIEQQGDIARDIFFDKVPNIII